MAKIAKPAAKAAAKPATKPQASRKAKVAEPEPPAKRKRKAEVVEEVAAPVVVTEHKSGRGKIPDYFTSQEFLEMSKKIDKVEDKHHCHSAYMEMTNYLERPISTGIITYDLKLGGGLCGGRVHVEYGGERAAKTTRCTTLLGNCVVDGVFPSYYDAESAVSPAYMDRILRKACGFKLDQLQGIKDAKGNWEAPPLVRYYLMNMGRKFFLNMRDTLLLLPDVEVDREGNYFKVYEKRGGGEEWVPYDGYPQALFLEDSVAALNPSIKGDETDENNTMAALARLLAWGFPQIKGLLGQKNAALFMTNQLRKRPGVTLGCVHADTVIPFVDGRHFTMREVVDNKIQGDVWSISKSGVLQPKPITGWHDNGLANPGDWLHIESGAIKATNGVCGITVTKNHKCYTARGWVEAQNITRDDMLATHEELIINGTLREFLAGVFVGDSSLVKLKSPASTALLMLTNNEQISYNNWKLAKLADAFPMLRYEASNGFIYKSYPSRELASWKTLVGKRSVKNLGKFFTAMSLAVWYMDDGYGDRLERKDSRASICVARFAKQPDEITAFIALLRSNFGLSATVSASNRNLNFSTSESQKLFALIAKYVPECMEYKLPLKFRGAYRDFELRYVSEHIVSYVPIRCIRQASARQLRQMHKYDLTVADNHSYMAGNCVNGVIIHNSPNYMNGGDTFYHNNDMRAFTEARHCKAAEMQCTELGFDMKTGENFSSEPSIQGGRDEYHYQRIRVEKNKYHSANKTVLMRTRHRHNGKPGDGVCEVYDLYQFLRATGQVTLRSKQLTLNVDGVRAGKKVPDLLGANGQVLSWIKFKELVEDRKTYRDCLRAHCQKQIASGYAFDLEAKASKAGGGSVDDADNED